MVFVVLLTALAACTAESGREAALPDSPTASVETFLPSEVRNIFQRSCETCHGLDSKGIAGVAPGILSGARRSPEEWIRYFSETPGAPPNEINRLHPGARLPSTIWMNPDEIKTVAMFLANRNQSTESP